VQELTLSSEGLLDGQGGAVDGVEERDIGSVVIMVFLNKAGLGSTLVKVSDSSNVRNSYVCLRYV
jgi:hypothetical protein